MSATYRSGAITTALEADPSSPLTGGRSSLCRRRGSRYFVATAVFGIIAHDRCGRRGREAPRHTRVGGSSRCRPGRRRRRHVADAPLLTRVFSMWGQTIDAGVLRHVHPRRPHGRRSAVLHLMLARALLSSSESRPVGGDPRSAISYARVWPPSQWHRRRIFAGVRAGAQRVQRRHHDWTAARVHRRPVLGVCGGADRRHLLGSRGTARSDAVVAGDPRGGSRGAPASATTLLCLAPTAAQLTLRLAGLRGRRAA